MMDQDKKQKQFQASDLVVGGEPPKRTNRGQYLYILQSIEALRQNHAGVWCQFESEEVGDEGIRETINLRQAFYRVCDKLGNVHMLTSLEKSQDGASILWVKCETLTQDIEE